VGCHADGFVNDHELVIVQQDLQAFHDFLHDFQRVPAAGHHDVQHHAGGQLEGFPDTLGVAADVAFGDQDSRLGAGNLHQLGQAGVHARSGKVFRDGEAPVFRSRIAGFAGHFRILRHLWLPFPSCGASRRGRFHGA
jgi:hypothetical protein